MSTNTQRTSSSQPNKMSTNTGGWLLDENGRWTSNAYWLAGGAALTVAAGVFLYNRVLIARPSEYIVKTGVFIKDVSIAKRTVQLPFQVNAMSQQRIPFMMPTVWTIGPRLEVPHLETYAKLFLDRHASDINHTIEGVIQGETRILTASMDLDELFQDREKFKNLVMEKIDIILNDFGLRVYNANIEELQDMDEHNKYFDMQKRKALQEVNENARVEVARAIRDGETGEKYNQGQTRQQLAQIEKDAKLVEYERDREIAEAKKNLNVAEAEYRREVQVAKSVAEAAAQKRESELQKEVEAAKNLQETERLRAEQMSSTNVQAEARIRDAEGRAQAERIQAEIEVEKARHLAEAMKITAEAELYQAQKKAEGVLAMLHAEADGLAQQVEAAGGVEGFNQYLLVNSGTLPKLAEQHARLPQPLLPPGNTNLIHLRAVHGMQPKITYWNTGDHPSGFPGLASDLMRTFEMVKQNTGYDAASFLPKAGDTTTSKSTPNVGNQNDDPIPKDVMTQLLDNLNKDINRYKRVQE